MTRSRATFLCTQRSCALGIDVRCLRGLRRLVSDGGERARLVYDDVMPFAHVGDELGCALAERQPHVVHLEGADQCLHECVVASAFRVGEYVSRAVYTRDRGATAKAPSSGRSAMRFVAY